MTSKNWLKTEDTKKLQYCMAIIAYKQQLLDMEDCFGT